MASPRPVSCPEARAASYDAVAIIDRQHLVQQTAGDVELARALLDLFATQSATIIMALEQAPSTDQRRDLVHLLKGSALAIGASRVASAAVRCERILADPDGTGVDHGEFGELVQAVAEARAAIAALPI